jgi:hypothetical protein
MEQTEEAEAAEGIPIESAFSASRVGWPVVYARLPMLTVTTDIAKSRRYRDFRYLGRRPVPGAEKWAISQSDLQIASWREIQ